MFKQVVKLCFLVVFVGLAGRTAYGRAGELVQVPVVGLERDEALEPLLRATVQLMLFSPAGLVEADGPEMVRTSFVQTGLGSLVAFGKNTLLLTHDHWVDLEAVQRVEILNFEGDLVAEVDGDAFRSWFLFQDGGTLALAVPGFLGQSQGLRPAELGHLSTVQPGDVVLVAHQDPEEPARVAFLPAEVLSLEDRASLQAWKLRGLSGEPVVRGDSGGVVWLDGRLVGNNWRTDVLVVKTPPILGDGGVSPTRPSWPAATW